MFACNKNKQNLARNALQQIILKNIGLKQDNDVGNTEMHSRYTMDLLM